jgi:adenylate kinase
MVQAVKHVHQAFISSGRGWLDAAPEIEIIQPDIFIVNNDGDRLEKRRFCKKRGIDYIVLERKPKKGLPQRSSTDLRGF